jgi:pseudaminic acid synthase
MRMNSFSLGRHRLSPDSKPIIIAEMSGNHNQSLDRALALVDAAAGAGAHALKLQTYTPDSLTLDVKDGDFLIQDPKSLWNGQSLYDLYKTAFTPWEWHRPIFERAQAHGMDCISTPFDDSAVDFLEDLGVPYFKIASFENNHLPLLRKVAKTGKPIVLSTGLATLSDLEDAVECIRSEGNSQIVLLKCTSSYPASPENTNILTIPHLAQLFDCPVGLSDHTMGVGVAVASVALGSRVIEKHFTLARSDGGVDSAFSLEPAELKLLVEESERAFLALGKVTYGPTKAEEGSIKFRRSIYTSRDIAAGDRLTPDNIRIVRPGMGLAPKYFSALIGRSAKKALKKGVALRWDVLE